MEFSPCSVAGITSDFISKAATPHPPGSPGPRPSLASCWVPQSITVLVSLHLLRGQDGGGLGLFPRWVVLKPGAWGGCSRQVQGGLGRSTHWGAWRVPTLPAAGGARPGGGAGSDRDSRPFPSCLYRKWSRMHDRKVQSWAATGHPEPSEAVGTRWESTSAAHRPAKPVLQSWLLSRAALSQPKTLKNLLVPRRRLHTGQGVTAANSSKALGIPVANRLVPGADRRAAQETG